jgi:DNA-binding transcriptional LysR family regulator
MDRFQQMQVFAGVVDAGSFVKAAEMLGMSRAAVSRFVGELESRLGVRLLHRTTRTLSLTSEGEIFHVRCKTLLAELAEAEAEITHRTGYATGQLKINVPVTFGLFHLAPLWSEFMERHPQVSLDVTLSDRIVDLVGEGYDLAIRIAQLPSSSLISRKLATTRMVLCASPAYLTRRGVPSHPEELVNHAMLTYSLFSMGEQWEFQGPSGPVSVRVTPRLRSNNGDTCVAVARQHGGIILQPSFLVAEDLRQGTLVEVLPDYRSIALNVYAVYPSRQHVSPKVRLLIDFLVAAFSAPSWE